MFIVFEGIDGCGKTTQSGLLYQKLKNIGVDTLATREPGGTRLGEMVRRILLNPDHDEMCDPMEVLLYVAARAQFVHEVVAPALAEGKVVLSDRFTSSTIAYQGYGRGLDIGQLKHLNEVATGPVKPDLVVIFDLDPEIAVERIGGKKDRLEQQDLDFFHRVRNGYLKEAQNAPETHLVLSALDTQDELAKQVWDHVRLKGLAAQA